MLGFPSTSMSGMSLLTSPRATCTTVCIMLSGSKMDPFQLGCPVIISCTGTPVCGACEAWCIIQQHQWAQTSPDASFLHIDGRSLDCLTLVRHIKDIVTQLGCNPSRYSGHSLHTGGHFCETGRALPVANKVVR